MMAAAKWDIEYVGRDAYVYWRMEHRCGDVMRRGSVRFRWRRRLYVFGGPDWRREAGYAPPEFIKWMLEDMSPPAESSAPLAAAQQRASAPPAPADQNPHPPILTREEPK